ncbi:hypothetical protein Agub_g2850, partial [Astrephomene gubernaculifera]
QAVEPALKRGVAVAQRLRRALKDELSLTVSVGVAPTKLAARLAGPANKPDAITVVPACRVRQFMAAVPLKTVPTLTGKAGARVVSELLGVTPGGGGGSGGGGGGSGGGGGGDGDASGGGGNNGSGSNSREAITGTTPTTPTPTTMLVGQLLCWSRPQLVGRFGSKLGNFLADLPYGGPGGHCGGGGGGGEDTTLAHLRTLEGGGGGGNAGAVTAAAAAGDGGGAGAGGGGDCGEVRDRGPPKSLLVERSFPPLTRFGGVKAALVPLVGGLWGRVVEDAVRHSRQPSKLHLSWRQGYGAVKSRSGEVSATVLQALKTATAAAHAAVAAAAASTAAAPTPATVTSGTAATAGGGEAAVTTSHLLVPVAPVASPLPYLSPPPQQQHLLLQSPSS